MVTCLRISTDGMARLFFIAGDGRDAAEVTARGSANKAGLVADPERGRFDQAEIPPKLCLLCAGGKRALGFTRRKGSNGDSDAPHAEVALGVEVAGRRAPDRGVAGNIDCVGD